MSGSSHSYTRALNKYRLQYLRLALSTDQSKLAEDDYKQH
jgi:hypothetical protein